MVSWVNNQGNSENYCSVSGFLLWKTEEMGNVLILLQQSFPSISPGILNLLSSAGFWNTPYTKSTAKAKLPLAQLIPVAEEVTAGAQRQKIPQSLLEASVDPIKGHSLFSTGDQPPHLVESKQSSWQKKNLFLSLKVWNYFILSRCFPLFKIISQY